MSTMKQRGVSNPEHLSWAAREHRLFVPFEEKALEREDEINSCTTSPGDPSENGAVIHSWNKTETKAP